MTEDTTTTEGKFLPLGTVVAGLAAIILVVFGWLFNLLVDNIRDIEGKQKIDQQQIVTNDVTIGTNTRRIKELEIEQLYTTRLRAIRPQKEN
ncbi:MAG: hypothetical protein DRI46_10890 [Chloroflexi bacterium]|nr:MAG: hypothetical protein DRI46_10890 [Chloroflexota bacterium]